MVLEFIGADHEVTGSCHFMSVGGKNLTVYYITEKRIKSSNLLKNLVIYHRHVNCSVVYFAFNGRFVSV